MINDERKKILRDSLLDGLQYALNAAVRPADPEEMKFLDDMMANMERTLDQKKLYSVLALQGTVGEPGGNLVVKHFYAISQKDAWSQYCKKFGKGYFLVSVLDGHQSWEPDAIIEHLHKLFSIKDKQLIEKIDVALRQFGLKPLDKFRPKESKPYTVLALSFELDNPCDDLRVEHIHATSVKTAWDKYCNRFGDEHIFLVAFEGYQTWLRYND